MLKGFLLKPRALMAHQACQSRCRSQCLNELELSSLLLMLATKLKSRVELGGSFYVKPCCYIHRCCCYGYVGLPKAKTPDNRPKWQVIYHIQPFLAVYSCLCCHYDDDHEASLPAQDMQQAAISCFCTKDFQAARHHAEQNIYRDE